MHSAFDVKNLFYRYNTSKDDVIRGVDFRVEQGEIFGLLGPSGAGKTTIQKILIKLLNDYRGEILYFGRDLRTVGRSIYNEIGVGFEMPVHFLKMSAMENMRFFSGFYEETADVRGIMERVGLWEHRDVKVGEYSKGMKVRLNFVRALLNRPRMLFLDEVTNGLDPGNARIIKDIISEFRAKGGTVFLSTHLMNDVEQLCDRVAFCVNGRLGEVSSPRDLKIKYGKREVKVEYRENGDLSEAMFPMEGIGGNEAFLALLKGKEIETIHSGETTMEDIFIRVTGVAVK